MWIKKEKLTNLPVPFFLEPFKGVWRRSSAGREGQAEATGSHVRGILPHLFNNGLPDTVPLSVAQEIR